MHSKKAGGSCWLVFLMSFVCNCNLLYSEIIRMPSRSTFSHKLGVRYDVGVCLICTFLIGCVITQ